MIEEGYKCAFTPTSKGFHEHAVDKRTCGNVFGIEGLETRMDCADGTCYATLGIDIDESSDTDQIKGVERKDDDNKINNAPDEGVIENSSGNLRASRVLVTAIDTIEASNEMKTERARRFELARCFPLDVTMKCSCSTNGIKNNPITRRCMDACKEI